MTDNEMPDPLEIVNEQDALNAFFPDGRIDLTIPVQVAALWLGGLDPTGDRGTAEQLTYQPANWDLDDVARLTDGFGVALNAEPSTDPDICWVKLRANTEHNVRAFGTAQIREGAWLTMVRLDDGTWRVWGMSPLDDRPTVDRIYGRG
ncbi:hypothetical protein FHX74_002551 [Friedmanniella endophytica]|uniref:Uncharacterized protein n=1 Tax=Microlunatus kandeliicorticis TaxID=1759536 RepID=A0A7W3P6F5_9ACTN|nr:hypothetical protein [Microlunatus kandeliicorticis]MBA8794923.1 hypothetical protein [Microlunatus kandeliicorticis]